MLEKLFPSLATCIVAMDCERDGELLVELNRSPDNLVGVLRFEQVCEKWKVNNAHIFLNFLET